MENFLGNFDNLTINSNNIRPSEIKANITKSQKNRPQLHHLGYYFRLSFSNEVNGKRHWRCLANRCTASGYSFCDNIGETCEFYIVNDSHIDQPDLAKFELLERRRLIKERASNDKARKIVRLMEKPYDENVRILLPSYNADRQVIQRAQKACKPQYPKEPDSLSAIEIPDELMGHL
ncbi:unnamed protein product [Brachionus calyciflorus]|uniref:FLYWCH-type domain-containing protein n=1 Tax=Brachionus calyciflorus TaxID=104777 RepID=A0A814QDH8_9BILA|nr:unnamed protein product [Brachionus calyciflorus]